MWKSSSLISLRIVSNNHKLQTQRRISLAGWYKRRKPGRSWDGNNSSKSNGHTNPNCKEHHSKKFNLIEIAKPKTHAQDKFSIMRFLNPWQELSNIVPSEEMLHDKVESTTRTFGIVAALMGSLAAALLTFNPYDGYDTETVRGDSINNSSVRSRQMSDGNSQEPFSPLQPLKRRNTINFIEHVTFTHHIAGTSLLVSWGIKESQLDEIYTACCAGSFYSGVLTTVLSSVINAWLAATPPGAIRSFVRYHSWYIVALPALLGISTSLAGSALFIGLDREHGTPVSYVGLFGTLIGGASLGMVTGRGWIHTYKSLTKAVSKSSCKGGK